MRIHTTLTHMSALRDRELSTSTGRVSAWRCSRLVALLFLSAGFISGCDREDEIATRNGAAVRASADKESANLYPVFIQRPEGPPRVIVGTHADGSPLTASCTTCHNSREPNVGNNSADDLDIFHQDLIYAHGDLSCLSCHNPDDYDTLRLADDRALHYMDVMTLCTQCHSPQARAYNQGAHGGMTGYWDLTRGPRVRHSCLQCHDPHTPAFQRMTPTFKARDRFLSPATSEGNTGHD